MAAAPEAHLEGAVDQTAVGDGTPERPSDIAQHAGHSGCMRGADVAIIVGAVAFFSGLIGFAGGRGYQKVAFAYTAWKNTRAAVPRLWKAFMAVLRAGVLIALLFLAWMAASVYLVAVNGDRPAPAPGASTSPSPGRGPG